MILSLDQAKKCGFCYGVTEPLGYGEFDVSDTDDYMKAIVKLKKQISGLIEALQPELVTIEDVYGGLNRQTVKKLGWLQGVLMDYFLENEILFEVVPPSKWQGYHGLKGKNKKQQSLAVAKEYVADEELESDNTADAIMMWYYAKNEIKPKIFVKPLDE